MLVPNYGGSMKKISIVLMVAVLAVGFVFAETTFTGSANLDFDYDLDTQEFGFANGTAFELNWGFTLDSGEASSTGEGDIYAEIAGSFAYTFGDEDTTIDETTDLGALDLDNGLKVGIDTANIHVGDLTIGILDAGAPDTYATDFDDDATDAIDGFSVTAPAGFNFAFNDVCGGFGLSGDVDGGTYDAYLWAGIADYAVSDALKASINGYIQFTDGADNFGFAAKAAYATDDVTANVAVDYESEKNLEAAADATVAGVTANVYVYTADMAVFDFNAKIATTVAGFDVYVAGDDLYRTARSLEVGESATFGALTEEVSVKYAFNDKVVTPTEKLTYAADMFEVYEKVSLGLDLDATDKLASLVPEIGISSDVIVNGATLSATWSGSDFLAATVDPGAVKLSCKVEF